MVKNLPATRETWVWSLAWEEPLEEGLATHSCVLAWWIPMDWGAGWAIVPGVTKSQTWLRAQTRVTVTSSLSCSVPESGRWCLPRCSAGRGGVCLRPLPLVTVLWEVDILVDSELSVQWGLPKRDAHFGQPHQAAVQRRRRPELCSVDAARRVNWPACHSPLTQHAHSFPLIGPCSCPSLSPLLLHLCLRLLFSSEGAVQTHFSVWGTGTSLSFRFISLLPLSAHGDSEGDIAREPSLRGNHLAWSLLPPAFSPLPFPRVLCFQEPRGPPQARAWALPGSGWSEDPVGLELFRPPEQLQTRLRGPECLGMDPTVGRKSARGAGKQPVSLLVSGFMTGYTSFPLGVSECQWMSVNHEIKEQEGLFSITFLSLSCRLCPVLPHMGQRRPPATRSSFPRKDARPLVQECVSPVKTYLFGPVLLGAKKNKMLCPKHAGQSESFGSTWSWEAVLSTCVCYV